jgi:Holliday junction resolvase
MTSPQKAKGGSFEREIAQFLTTTFGETFIRAPGSGAYVGGSNKARKQVLHEGQVRSFKGDIVPGQSFGKLNAECKSYKDFPFHQLFQGKVKQLEDWISQCMDVADQGDFSIVFMKFNRKGKFIAFQHRHQVNFNLGTHITYNSKNHGTWVFMALEDFFQHNFQQFTEVCKS